MHLSAKLRSVVLLVAAATSLVAQKSRVSGAIDQNRSVRLTGNVNPWARLGVDAGPVEHSFEIRWMTLVLGPSEEQQRGLDQLLAEQQDRFSRSYHKWLTPEEYGDRFGASRADVAAIVSWLESRGFRIERVARARDRISFSGTAAQVQTVFKTEIHRYVLSGELHFANVGDPAVPAAMLPAVTGFLGLNDFRPRPAIARGKPRFNDPNNGSHFLVPGDIATIYDLNSIYNGAVDGTGQKIAVIGQAAVDLSDVAAFRSMFGLAANAPTLVLGGPSPNGTDNDLLEADLDLEWAGAAAKNATLLYVYADNAYTAASYAIDNNLAPIVSFSFGSCENAGSFAQTLRTEAQKANALGITWLASSGDTGAAGCDANGAQVAQMGLTVGLPASIPEVTAVGGTEFNEFGGTYWQSSPPYLANAATALSYIPEKAWNDTNSNGLSASGGGASSAFSKPAWQNVTGVPSDGARDLPDISFTASPSHDGYVYCHNGNCASGDASQAISVGGVVGGTSAPTPFFAGVLALLNQYLVRNGLEHGPGLGNINPTLYRLFQSAPAVFHDVVSGDNVVPCQSQSPDCATGSYGYSAGPGYDLVTGLGSLDAYSLLLNWNSDACTFTISTGAALSSSSQNGALVINTQSLCPWTAWSDAAWLTISSSANGTGSGSVSYAVTANNNNTSRTGALHIAGQTFTVTQSPGIAPNLVITNLTGPTSAVAGNQISASATVRNQGNVSAGSFSVEFYFSSTPTITTGSSDSGSSCTVASLAVGGTKTCTVTVNVPATLTAGQWYLGAIVDPTNVIVEQNESDNARVADSGAITVALPPPVLQIMKSHVGNFGLGQAGTYTVLVTNTGAGPTSGPVTVTENPPTGLTITQMSGTGWTCGTSTCTRSDALAAHLSYPAITATANVASNATSPLVNNVSVSGGGSVTASATDSTVVTGVSISANAARCFTAFVLGASSRATSWTISPQAGTLYVVPAWIGITPASVGSNSADQIDIACYTPANTGSIPASIILTATSLSNPNLAGSITLDGRTGAPK